MRPAWGRCGRKGARSGAIARRTKPNSARICCRSRQRVCGTSYPERYDPDLWVDEYRFLTSAGQLRIQTELFYDYRTNVAAYPEWQRFLRERQPPLLVVWGRYDPSFNTAGAPAYRDDVPDAEIHILDAGHFALDEATDEIAALSADFLTRRAHG
jgi:pimeloyl-ACP methyl ester carboxylesterase